jgi:hypothetical protein
MPRQSLIHDKAMRLITARHGKHGIHDWRNYLKRHVPELISVDVDLAEIENARNLIGLHRKRSEVPDQLLNLIEETEEGERIPYYKPARETTFAEAKQHLTNLFQVCNREQRKFHEHFRYQTERHGEQLELALDFPIPAPPIPTELEPA